MYHGADRIINIVPVSSSKQSSALAVCERILKDLNIQTVMDLGCGKGNSIDFFTSINPGLKWIGVDIEKSPEVEARKKQSDRFITYDGVNLPFEDNKFDLIFCQQVLEHVEQPRKLLKEVSRVLISDGYFVGQTSHLEAFHSLSLWNYTPYGLKLLFDEASLKMLEVRPGIDAFTLLLNRFLRRSNMSETMVNRLLGFMARIAGKNHQEINLLKLLFCGHFVFLAQKRKP